MKKLLTMLLFALATGTVMGQRTISGKISAPDGEALIGATVVVKGTTVGAKTDLNGDYKLNVSEGATTLVVTYSGYKTTEATIDASNVADIVLEEGLILQETVVTAFGVKKDKSNLGYAVSEISSKDLTTARVTNVTNALNAKVPGIRISGSGGSFTGSSIIIRGYTTFTGSNQPLFVVDGVPIDNSGGDTPLQSGPALSNRAIDLNQEDIESISVLKGAAATALYGSRAASGVILITMKKGRSGQKNSITYNANYAFQEVNRLPDYQNEYAQGTLGTFNPAAISSWGPRINGQQVPLPSDYRNKLVSPNDSVSLAAYPDNVKDIFRRGSNMQHNLSFQGSKDASTYRLSLGYLDDRGVLDNNRLKRYNVGLNASTEITSKLTAAISVNYTYNTSDRTQQGNQLSNPLFRSWFTPRSWNLSGLPFENATGGQLHYDAAVDNPYWTIKNNLYNDLTTRVFGNFSLRYQLTNWLSAEYRLGVDNYAFKYSGYDQLGARGGANTAANQQGGIVEGIGLQRTLNSYFTLNGTKQLTDDLALNFVLGQETVDDVNNFSQVVGRGITVRNFRNLNANTTTFVPTYSTSRGRIIGAFGNVTTSFRNVASLDLSLRNDWNSTLLSGNNSYLYYSAAGTFNLTEAIPVLKSRFLSLAKLRANYGRVGRASLRYATDSYYITANPTDGFGPNIQFPYNGLPGFTLSNTAGNPNLKPEFTATAEVGLDLSALNDRISLEFTLYQQKSTQIILSVPNSPTSGISEVVLNAGSLKTNGIEVGLTLTPIKTSKGFWSSTFNFTQFKSTVEELAPGVDNIFLGGFVTPNIRLVEGDAYGQAYGSAYQRDAQGRLLLNANGLPLPTANVQKIGNPNPDWTLGVNNNITYQAFSLNFLLDIRKGGDQYSRNLADLRRNGAVAETAEFNRLNEDGITVGTPYRFDGVFAPGTPNAGQVNEGAVEKRVSAQDYWGNSGRHVAAEGFVYDISWFRVREASLTYSVPKRLLTKSFLGALDISIFGRNLFLYAPNYPHLDPEQNALGINNAQGLEFNALPQTRSFGLNLRATL